MSDSNIMAPLNDQSPYTQISCRLILDETFRLLKLTKLSETHSDRLNILLSKHFANNQFRSLCCFGNSAGEVPLELFKTLCVLPSTDWNVHLAVSEHSSTIWATWADSSAATPDFEMKYNYIATNIATLLVNLSNSHPQKELICSCITRSAIISPPWIMAILGRKRDSSYANFVAPSLGRTPPPNFYIPRRCCC